MNNLLTQVPITVVGAILMDRSGRIPLLMVRKVVQKLFSLPIRFKEMRYSDLFLICRFLHQGL